MSACRDLLDAVARVLTRFRSASKGIEERDYEFAFDLYDEVVPEVRQNASRPIASQIGTDAPSRS